MPEAAEHHREERLVAGHNLTQFYYACIAACNQGEFAFLHIAGGQEVGTRMTLPQLLTPECQEETFAVSKQADVLAEQTFQCLRPSGRHCDEQLCTNFIPNAYTYNSTHLQSRGMQAGGRRVLSCPRMRPS